MPPAADLFDILLKIAVLGCGLAVLWLAFRPRYEFVVRVDSQRSRVTRGKVTARFREAVVTAFQDAGLSRGWVAGVRRGKLIALAFSRNTPPDIRQRLRNQWLAGL